MYQMKKGGKSTPKMKKGGSTSFGMLSVKKGIDKNPAATHADRIAGATMKKGGSVGSSRMKKYREGGPGGTVKPKFGDISKNESIYGKPGLGQTVKTPSKSDIDAMFGNTTIGQNIKIKKASVGKTPGLGQKIKKPSFGESASAGPNKKFKMGGSCGTPKSLRKGR